MFTGLIQKTGLLKKIERDRGGTRIDVSATAWDQPLVTGESIAVNGACLTVARIAGNDFSCDVLNETMDKTSLSGKKSGDALNLERALRVGDAIGGHLVSGHVDGTGVVLSVTPAGRDKILKIGCRQDLLNSMVLKGSICCDGVSLTIAELTDDSFSVHLIPVTWQDTALRFLSVGRLVNIETDMLGKYAAKSMRESSTVSSGSTVTMDMLNNAGFM